MVQPKSEQFLEVKECALYKAKNNSLYGPHSFLVCLVVYYFSGSVIFNCNNRNCPILEKLPAYCAIKYVSKRMLCCSACLMRQSKARAKIAILYKIIQNFTRCLYQITIFPHPTFCCAPHNFLA